MIDYITTNWMEILVLILFLAFLIRAAAFIGNLKHKPRALEWRPNANLEKFGELGEEMMEYADERIKMSIQEYADEIKNEDRLDEHENRLDNLEIIEDNSGRVEELEDKVKELEGKVSELKEEIDARKASQEHPSPPRPGEATPPWFA